MCVWLLTSCFTLKRLLNLSEPVLSCIKMQIKLAESLQGLNEVIDMKNLAWCVQGSKHLMDFSLVVLKILLVTN